MRVFTVMKPGGIGERVFDLPGEESGPLAPLDVLAEPVVGGTVYRLFASSQDRIMRRLPNAHLVGEVFFSTEDQQEHERKHGPIWDHVGTRLLGLTEEQINELGGYRVQEHCLRTLYESALATS